MVFSTLDIHDVDSVTLCDSLLLNVSGNSIFTRKLVVRCGDVKFTINLYAADKRCLEVHEVTA